MIGSSFQYSWLRLGAALMDTTAFQCARNDTSMKTGAISWCPWRHLGPASRDTPASSRYASIGTSLKTGTSSTGRLVPLSFRGTMSCFKVRYNDWSLKFCRIIQNPANPDYFPIGWWLDYYSSGFGILHERLFDSLLQSLKVL